MKSTTELFPLDSTTGVSQNLCLDKWSSEEKRVFLSHLSPNVGQITRMYTEISKQCSTIASDVDIAGKSTLTQLCED